MKFFLLLLASAAIQTVYANTGAIPLTHDEGLWYGTVQVGTPAKTFTVVFDTGSSDLILPGATCKTCSGHTLFTPSDSSTSQDLGKQFSIAFEGSSETSSGELYTDTVSIGGLTAHGQTVGIASQYSTSLEKNRFPADGILGLAFSTISTSASSPVFESLVQQGQPTSSVFAFKLSTDASSELFLGGTDSSLYTGEITYTPLTIQGFWQVNLDSLTAGGNKEVLSHQQVRIDTTSPLIVLSLEQARDFYAAVLGAASAEATVGSGHYTVRCDAIPSVSLTFHGRSFVMNSDSFNLGKVSSGSPDCVGAIVGQDLGLEGLPIVGTAFLQNVYSVFDFGNTQVGFATLA